MDLLTFIFHVLDVVLSLALLGLVIRALLLAPHLHEIAATRNQIASDTRNQLRQIAQELRSSKASHE